MSLKSNSVLLVLSEAELAKAHVESDSSSKHQIIVAALEPDVEIDNDLLHKANAVVLEIRPDVPASIKRFSHLREMHPDIPVVAAIRDADLGVVRMLVRQGARDVIGLPLVRQELSAILEEIFKAEQSRTADHALGTLTSVVKSIGGVGATTIATHVASELARQNSGRGVCLIDLDLQFGEAASYIGVKSTLTIADLLDSGSRIDRELLRSVVATTPTGLHVLQAPLDIMPLEATDQDQILRIVELAQAEYDHVVLDLPTNWTNWTLSLLAMSDPILLVIELTIASLRQAKRQLQLMQSQDVSPKKVHIIANRVERKLFRSIDLSSAAQAIGHPVQFSIHNDYPLISAAHDQGVLIREIRAKSKIIEDIENLVPVIAGAERD